jgi:hypothetical protein
MKKISTKKSDQAIAELRREQLGTGVRGKYFDRFTSNSNMVALQPELIKAFPTSAAVNRALTSLLAFVEESQRLTSRPSLGATKKRAA